MLGDEKMAKYRLKKEDIYCGDLILVNRDYKIQFAIAKEELESVDKNASDILLHKKANTFLQQALSEIKADNKILPVSGYRSLEEQQDIFTNSMKENGKEFTLKYVAYPNASEHQTGLAIDLGLNEGEIDFICPSFPHYGICEEFRNIAFKYGFIERYQEEKKQVTKIGAEEWHFRYIGYPHSEIIQKNNFCLEEYHEYIKKYETTPLIYKNFEIQYFPFKKDVEIELSEEDQLSGNNIDGIIVTRKIR